MHSDRHSAALCGSGRHAVGVGGWRRGGRLLAQTLVVVQQGAQLVQIGLQSGWKVG